MSDETEKWKSPTGNPVSSDKTDRYRNPCMGLEFEEKCNNQSPAETIDKTNSRHSPNAELLEALKQMLVGYEIGNYKIQVAEMARRAIARAEQKGISNE